MDLIYNNWKKLIVFILCLPIFIQIAVVSDVFLNANKPLKLEKVAEGKYKGKLYLRNFYVYENKDGGFEINRFPETSFGDGINYYNSILGWQDWAYFVKEDLGLDSNSAVIPYDASLLFISTIGLQKIIIFKIDKKNNPYTISYTIESKPK